MYIQPRCRCTITYGAKFGHFCRIGAKKKTNRKKENAYLVNLDMLEKFNNGYIFRRMINGRDINDVRYLPSKYGILQFWG